MPIDNLSKITSRSGINTTILLEAGNANVTGIVTAAGFDGPFTGGSGSDINAGIVTAANGLHVGAGGTIIHALSEDDGKVGIGTDSPTDILDVYSTTDPTIRSRSALASVGANIEVCGGSSNDSQLILSSGTTAKYQFFRDGSQSDDLRIYDGANSLDIIRYRHGGYLHFGVNGAERLRINDQGKILIHGGGATGANNTSCLLYTSDAADD